MYTDLAHTTTVLPCSQGRRSRKSLVEPDQNLYRVPETGVLGPGKAILLWWTEAWQHYLGRRLRWRGLSYLQGL